MYDRIPQYPGRVKLTPVPGQDGVYDMVRADSPTQEGTPMNKASLLTDETAAMYGLGSDAVPNEVLQKIANLGKIFPIKTEVILESGTWTAPEDIVGLVKVYAFGGGGGGGTAKSKGHASAGGGGGGHMNIAYVDASPGTTIPVVIGAGGEGHITPQEDGGNGGDTSFGSIVARGGEGGKCSSEVIIDGTTVEVCGRGGDGGTGGGGSTWYDYDSSIKGKLINYARGGHGSYGGGGGGGHLSGGGNGGTFGGGGGNKGEAAVYGYTTVGKGGRYGGDGGAFNDGGYFSEPTKGVDYFGWDPYDRVVLGLSYDGGYRSEAGDATGNSNYYSCNGGGGGGGFGSTGGAGSYAGGDNNGGATGGGGILAKGGGQNGMSGQSDDDVAAGSGGGGFGVNGTGGSTDNYEYSSGGKYGLGGAGGGGCGVLGLNGKALQSYQYLSTNASAPKENESIAAGGMGAPGYTTSKGYIYNSQDGGQGVVILAYMVRTNPLDSVE